VAHRSQRTALGWVETSLSDFQYSVLQTPYCCYGSPLATAAHWHRKWTGTGPHWLTIECHCLSWTVFDDLDFV
jgi:hypothetical protein